MHEVSDDKLFKIFISPLTSLQAVLVLMAAVAWVARVVVVVETLNPKPYSRSSRGGGGGGGGFRSGLKVSTLGLRNLGFMVWGLGFRV